MRFISGLKNLGKKTILVIILILFIISWLLFVIGFVILEKHSIGVYIQIFLGILAGFTFVLIILSFLRPLDRMGAILIILAVVLTIPVLIIFGRIIGLFYYFCFFANAAITAFFAFKFCMDTSTAVDDFLYKKKGSRIFTRTLEFIIFLLLSWWFVSITIRFFRGFPTPGVQRVAIFFVNLFWIALILIVFVILRLIFTKKLAAYISLFDVLIFLYVIYLVIGLWAEFIFYDSSGYVIFTFVIDLLLFIYIIGSIFDRVDYIKDKLKIFRADTIALFVILMKVIVQINKISQEFMTLLELAKQVIFQVQILWFFFVIFTLIVGVYTIFKHKEGKTS